MYWGVQTKDGKNINVGMNDFLNNNSPYKMFEFSFRMKMAMSISKNNETKSIVQSRVEDLKFLFTMIAEKEKFKNADSLANYLFSYFKELSNFSNVEAFIYYIHQVAENEEITKWLDNNQDAVYDFLIWNDIYKN
jgi:hypothetical protein